MNGLADAQDLRLRFDVLTKTKQPELCRYWTTRDRAANVRLFRLAAEILQAIEAGGSTSTRGGRARTVSSAASAGRGGKRARPRDGDARDRAGDAEIEKPEGERLRPKAVLALEAVRKHRRSRPRPPFDPLSAARVRRPVEALGIRAVTGIASRPGWVATTFERLGVRYAPSALTRSDLYAELLTIINAREVELPYVPRLLEQLAGLHRRPGRSGRDAMSTPSGATTTWRTWSRAVCARAPRAR